MASVHLKQDPSWEEEQIRSLGGSEGNYQSRVVRHMIPQQASLNHTPNQVQVDTRSVFSSWSSEVGQLPPKRKTFLKETQNITQVTNMLLCLKALPRGIKINLKSLNTFHKAIYPGWKKHGGMKATLTLWPLGSALLYYHSACLCFDLFKPSLKVACSSVCGLQRLCRSSRLSERTSSLHTVTYKAIVLKEQYLSLVSTPLCSTCCMENIQ